MIRIHERWPFWSHAEHTQGYYTRVEVGRIYADAWSPARLKDCLEKCRANPAPPPVDLVRIMDEFFVAADGNHRVVACQRLGIGTIRASCVTYRYGPVLGRLVFHDGIVYHPIGQGWGRFERNVPEERFRELVELQVQFKKGGKR